MTLSPICIKNLLLSHKTANRCLCPRCRQEKKEAEAKEFYRLNLWQESAADPFPAKTGKIIGGDNGRN